MNHSRLARPASSADVRITRSTPSPPMPARRSHSARTRSAAQVAVDGAVVVGQQHEVVLGAVALEEGVAQP